MNNSQYRGVVVPMVTPVTQDGRLDTEAVQRIIDFFAQNKVSPLLMGTTGEGNSVSQADGQLFVETAVKAANGRILIYAGLTGNCFAEQVRQAEIYTALGADVIVATLPTYYALTPDQMYEYYKTLADCITGPLMLYNILATTHMSIPVDIIKKLADHPNIVGLKRRGFSHDSIVALKEAFRLIWREDLNRTQALERVEYDVEQTPEIKHLVAFMHSATRGVS